MAGAGESATLHTHSPHGAATTWTLLQRGQALTEALRDGPLPRAELLARLGTVYPPDDSARRMVDRDLLRLAEIGIVIERSRTRPPIYTLRSTPLVFSDAELRVLALIRDTFGDRHPQAVQIAALLDRLTAQLSETQQRRYHQRQATSAPVQPAIDYTPYADLIARLEHAIGKQQIISFSYAPTHKSETTRHPRVEPYDIEFYERHFYLVAYTRNNQQVQDFRIDRIHGESVTVVPGGSWSHRRRRGVRFGYRLAAKLARGELSQRFADQQIVERRPNGDVIIEALGRSDFFIVQTLLRYAGSAELLWPERLRAQMAEDVAAMAAVYS